MIRAAAIFCCFVGFLVVLLIVSSTRQSGDVEAREVVPLSDGCTIHEVALDEGYGVTRKMIQRVCAKPE